MSDEFVRKDVHDAQIASLHSRIDDLHRRIDDVKNDSKSAVEELRSSLARGWAIVGVIAAVAAFAITAIQFYLSLRGGH